MVAPVTIRRGAAQSERDQLVEQHLAYARRVARSLIRRLPACADLEELESDAYLGLINAARTFDPGRGVMFRTYASRRIFGAIVDGLRARGQLRRKQPVPHLQSLDAPAGHDEGRPVTLGERIAADEPPIGLGLEQRDLIDSVLGKLDRASRRQFIDRDGHGLEQKEIARKLRISPSAVSQRMKRIEREVDRLVPGRCV